MCSNLISTKKVTETFRITRVLMRHRISCCNRRSISRSKCLKCYLMRVEIRKSKAPQMKSVNSSSLSHSKSEALISKFSKNLVWSKSTTSIHIVMTQNRFLSIWPKLKNYWRWEVIRWSLHSKYTIDELLLPSKPLWHLLTLDKSSNRRRKKLSYWKRDSSGCRILTRSTSRLTSFKTVQVE